MPTGTSRPARACSEASRGTAKMLRARVHVNIFAATVELREQARSRGLRGVRSLQRWVHSAAHLVYWSANQNSGHLTLPVTGKSSLTFFHSLLLVNDDDYERSDGVIRRSARSTRSDIENSNDPIDEFIDLSSSTTTTPFDCQPVRASPSIVPKNSHGRLTCARTLGPTSAWVGGLFRVRVVDVDVDLHSHGGVGKRARGTRGASKFFTRKCVPGAPQRFRAHEKTLRMLRTGVALAVGAMALYIFDVSRDTDFIIISQRTCGRLRARRWRRGRCDERRRRRGDRRDAARARGLHAAPSVRRSRNIWFVSSL